MEKKITWNLGKNSKLKVERGISMEQVYELIQREAYRVADNPNKKYRGQELFIVKINGRTYCVPFTEYENHVFLRTIFEV